MQKLVLSRGPNITLKVKRFLEQMAGGRNPYDCLVFIDSEDNVRVIGLDNESRFGGAVDSIAPGAILYLPNGEKASKVYAQVRNIYILSTTGKVYSTGLNLHGQAALPAGSGTANVTTPTLTAISNCVKVIHPTGHGGGQQAFVQSVMFLTTTGQVYSAGLNQVGNLGSGNTTSTANIDPYLTLGPGNPYGNPTTTVIDVVGTGSYNGSTNMMNYAALLSDGTVWCVGRGGEGQMGNGTTTAINSLWQQVQNAATSTALTGIVRIFGCGYHSGTSLYALNSSGELFSWGYNVQGQLGLGTNTNTTRATRVTPFGSGIVVDVYAFNANYGSVIVKMSNGDFYGCGYNGRGQLGLGDTTNRSTFTLITSLQNKNIEQIYYTGGDTESQATWAKEIGTNRIYVTGRNLYGEGGLYNTTAVTSFTEVPFNVVSPIIDIMPIITTGIGGYTLILTADGNTYFAGQSRWSYVGEPARNETIFRKNTKYIVGA